MKNILNFLIKINKLKEVPKTGWVLMKVKNPETIADHVFRVAIASWLLGEKKKLNIEKAIKIALSHDLCEVYAGDSTPFFYWEGLDRDKKKDEEILLKGTRLSKEEKEKRGKIKLTKEKKALSKLIKSLNPELKGEILSTWFHYEKRISKEGRFVKQIDRIETLLQSIEYFGTQKNKGGTSWWEGTEEIVEDPLLLEFLKVTQKKFYGKAPRGYKKQKELENILDFLLEIGKLKRTSRLYWTIRGIKSPETVAGHIFTLSLMAWIFGRDKKLKLNMEKLLKMALCHELTAVYTGDTTPYDEILPRSSKKREEILKRCPRLLKSKKTRIFLKNYKEEKKALQKLTLKLRPSLKKEIIQLWEEYRTRSSPEGHFLSQLNTFAVLFQALLYREKDKRFSTVPLWEWVFEISDNPTSFELIKVLKKRFG